MLHMMLLLPSLYLFVALVEVLLSLQRIVCSLTLLHMVVIVRFENRQGIIIEFLKPMTALNHFWAIICVIVISSSNFFSLILVILFKIILLNVYNLFLRHFLSLERFQ